MALAAFLGLGVMGFPMAGHLRAAGHEVTVWNRTAAKAQAWAARHDGKVAGSPADAARQADVVFMCLGDDPDVRAIAVPLLEEMKSGSILVDHTTASAQLARELHERAAACQIGFADAPVSGGQAGAENGQLSIMCGGDAAVFAKIVS